MISKCVGFLLHVGRTSAEISAIHTFLGGSHGDYTRQLSIVYLDCTWQLSRVYLVSLCNMFRSSA